MVLEGHFTKPRPTSSQIPQEEGFRLRDLTKNWQLSPVGSRHHHPAWQPRYLDSQSRLQGHLKNTYEKQDLVGVSGSFLVAAWFLHPFYAHDQKKWEKVWAEEAWRAQTLPFQMEERSQKKAKRLFTYAAHGCGMAGGSSTLQTYRMGAKQGSARSESRFGLSAAEVTNGWPSHHELWWILHSWRCLKARCDCSKRALRCHGYTEGWRSFLSRLWFQEGGQRAGFPKAVEGIFYVTSHPANFTSKWHFLPNLPQSILFVKHPIVLYSGPRGIPSGSSSRRRWGWKSLMSVFCLLTSHIPSKLIRKTSSLAQRLHQFPCPFVFI